MFCITFFIFFSFYKFISFDIFFVFCSIFLIRNSLTIFVYIFSNYICRWCDFLVDMFCISFFISFCFYKFISRNIFFVFCSIFLISNSLTIFVYIFSNNIFWFWSFVFFKYPCSYEVFICFIYCCICFIVVFEYPFSTFYSYFCFCWLSWSYFISIFFTCLVSWS